MAHCYLNNYRFHCHYVGTVDVNPDNKEEIVERSDTSLSCAWCFKHNCSCQSRGYYCSDFKKEFNQYEE